MMDNGKGGKARTQFLHGDFFFFGNGMEWYGWDASFVKLVIPLVLFLFLALS
jgi:hypothetical protein